MTTAPPTRTPPTGPSAATGVRFALVVFPESLQQRWHAVLLPEATAGAAMPLEFATPLDLLRHLAQLAPIAASPRAEPMPGDPASTGGLR